MPEERTRRFPPPWSVEERDESAANSRRRATGSSRGRHEGAGGDLPQRRGLMKLIFYALLAGSVLIANPAFAGQPVFVDGKGHPLRFVTEPQLQREWNAYVKVHAIKR